MSNGIYLMKSVNKSGYLHIYFYACIVFFYRDFIDLLCRSQFSEITHLKRDNYNSNV